MMGLSIWLWTTGLWLEFQVVESEGILSVGTANQVMCACTFVQTQWTENLTGQKFDQPKFCKSSWIYCRSPVLGLTDPMDTHLGTTHFSTHQENQSNQRILDFTFASPSICEAVHQARYHPFLGLRISKKVTIMPSILLTSTYPNSLESHHHSQRNQRGQQETSNDERYIWQKMSLPIPKNAPVG